MRQLAGEHVMTDRLGKAWCMSQVYCVGRLDGGAEAGRKGRLGRARRGWILDAAWVLLGCREADCSMVQVPWHAMPWMASGRSVVLSALLAAAESMMRLPSHLYPLLVSECEVVGRGGAGEPRG